MHAKSVAILNLVLILMLAVPAIPVAHTERAHSAQVPTPEFALSSQDFIEPVISHVEAIDQDFDNIQDRLENLIVHTLGVNRSARLPVVITLNGPVSVQDLEHFTELGGEVTYVYNYVTYGFAGAIPAVNLTLFADLEGERLCMVEYDTPLEYHLDLSTTLTRARPTAWNTYGYTGSANHSVAILDTGIDDSHSDLGPYQDLNFSKKIVGWYDATPDNSLTPEDYGEHGSHVSGIAAGTGNANSLQGSGTIQTTFSYYLPPAGYGYVDFIDIVNPGVIELDLQWDGPNRVLLRLYDPADTIVDEVLSFSSPSSITYSTTGSSYPTGRYMVLVGNYLGPDGAPFSCVETYPYEGLNDGYNLFTGVAPDSKLVGVKVFDNTGSGTLGILVNAMDWIVANRHTYHIVVASMSLSLIDGAVDTTLDQKADSMVQNGIVTVVSAGNDYPDFTIGSPGTAAYVLTVAATNDLNGITEYSSNGDTAKTEYGLIKPDVSAPGGTFNPIFGNKIISADSNDIDAEYSGFPDQNPDDYQQMGGTSMSAPHVAGLAALAAEAIGDWGWTLEEALKAKMLLCMTAFETQRGEFPNVPELNRGEKDSHEGYGRVNADALIEAATMTYTIGDEANAAFGLGSSDKKVWARQVYLAAEDDYTFNLTVPVGADYDLYLYNGTPDSYGQPIILAKSVSPSLGADETLGFSPDTSGEYYVVAKWVTGEGTFTLSSSTSLFRDVAVTNVTVSDALVYEEDIVAINVTVQNHGVVIESFGVTAFYNSTAIETKDVSNLAVGASEVLIFSWDTSGVQPCRNYTISAETSVLPEESNTLNNQLVDGDVRVKMQGDVNGDRIVNVLDLTIVSLAYGAFEGEPDYDPVADLNKDGFVDMKDMVAVARNLGKTCP